jgi:CubicO group peptidase (beta-lactamase class C family)
VTLRSDTAAALYAEVAAVQSASRLPSICAGVVQDGKLAWTGARGQFVSRHGGLPDSDTQYRIGSISKTLTAVLVMQCRDDGLLSLNDAVGKHLPGIAFGHLTIRNLLAHSGGMHAEPAGPWWERNPGVPFEVLTAAMESSEAAAEAEQRHHYSNLGYALLGEIVARLRGASWAELVQQRILDPLEMRRTSYLATGRAASGFSVHPWSGRLEDEPAYDAGAMAPAGQLWSTIEDLGRYAAFWIDPVREVLAPDTVEEMAAPRASDPAEALDASYGLGLRLHAAESHLLVGHSGSMPGFLAGLFVDRARRLGGITLANATTGGVRGVPMLAIDLLRTLASYEPPVAAEWLPEPELSQGSELLGPWYWGNTPYLLTVVDGTLLLRGLNGGRQSRFVPEGSDLYRGLDGYFAGEYLRVIAPDHLNLATYTLTRTPYGR